MDHLSVHRYVPHHRDDDDRERQYAAIVAAPVDVERRLRMVADTIDEVLGDGGDVKIAFDEWNVWLDANRSNDLEERYELRDALFAAGVFNALHRLCGELSMANLAQLVNVLPAMTTSRTGAWPTPIYRAFELYARRCGEIALSCRCECETFDADEFGNIPRLSNVPWLDASATISEDGAEIALAVVNRHPSEAIEAEIRVDEDEPRLVQQAVLNGASAAATTSPSTPRAVDIHVTSIDREPLPLSRRLPPHSVTFLTLGK
jgi:alpha-N-arabinofuranosidase